MDKLFRRLDEVVQMEEKRNKYDYDSTMKSLNREEFSEIKKKERKRQFRKASQHWRAKVETAKKLKEESIIEKRESIMNRISSKSKITLQRSMTKHNDISTDGMNNNRSLDNLNHSYSYTHSRSKSYSNLRSEKSISNFDYEQARMNVEKFQMVHEEHRLNLQQEIQKKLAKFSHKNQIFKNGIKKKFAEKFAKYGQVIENKKLRESEQNDLFVIKEQAEIERFHQYQTYLQSQKKKYVELKKKEKLKTQSIIENISDNQRIIEEKRKELEDRLINDKNRISKNGHRRLISIQSKESIGVDRVKSNSKLLEGKKEKQISLMLEKEKNTILKSNMREKSIDVSKHNSQ
jgi:hypothetical protein